jgi:hypothetical protein
MALDTKKWGDIAGLAIVVLLVQMALTKWIYPLFGKTTQVIFSINPQTAVTSPTVGNKVLGILSGIIPFNLGNIGVWVSMFIGVFVLLLLGYWVYEQSWAWKGKDIYQRLWAILFYGTAALYVVLLLLKSSVPGIAVPLLIGVLVNYLVIAVVVTMLAKNVKFIRI